MGSIFATREGSICANCYAKKGNYIFPNVIRTREENLAGVLALEHAGIRGKTEWAQAVSEAIRKAGSDYFRWHDSGDVQSLNHEFAIMMVARSCPLIKFYQPTKERSIVMEAYYARGLPPNLTIRLSAPFIDCMLPEQELLPTNVVFTQARGTGSELGYYCPATWTPRGHPHHGACLDCRACWDKRIRRIIYRKH
jgi:hypothetical protein